MRELDFNGMNTMVNPESTVQTAAPTTPNAEGPINSTSTNQRYFIKPKRGMDSKESKKRYDLPNARIKLMFYEGGLTDTNQADIRIE